MELLSNLETTFQRHASAAGDLCVLEALVFGAGTHCGNRALLQDRLHDSKVKGTAEIAEDVVGPCAFCVHRWRRVEVLRLYLHKVFFGEGQSAPVSKPQEIRHEKGQRVELRARKNPCAGRPMQGEKGERITGLRDPDRFKARLNTHIVDSVMVPLPIMPRGLSASSEAPSILV